MSALMVLGTASSVGKSWIATGLCRMLSRRGLRVLPFKAQNMSNNAAPARLPTGGWGEIGRAQAAQAAAAGVEPTVDMNPLLIKPTGGGGAQVVLLGEVVGELDALDHRALLPHWEAAAHDAYDRLSAQADVVVLEGAGSPAEINLRDIVNMPMARYAIGQHGGGALLVGDIDRGGVFAALKGTLDLLAPADRALVRGVIINRFRGDPRLLQPGPRMFEELSGVQVRGVVPWRPDIAIDEEDAQDLWQSAGLIDVCVLRLPTVSNFTDVTPLAAVPKVGLRYARTIEAIGNPDLLVLPGSKDTLADLRWLRTRGLDRGVRAAASRGVPILGLCGGYQLLGRSLSEDGETLAGLDLLDVHTLFDTDKRVCPTAGRTTGAWLLPPELAVEGYEIHQGRTAPGAQPLVTLADGSPDGACRGLIAGTYVHGLLDSAPVRLALVNALRERRALPPLTALEDATGWRERQYEAAADLLEEQLDIEDLLPRELR